MAEAVPAPETLPLYCDVSLPVPLERAFTYALPETLRHRVKPGCRLLVPFGTRKMTGFVVRVHAEPPENGTRDALRLLDAEPALTADMLALGRWIADYYCAPLGEVLRAMAPVGGEIRHGKVYTLTDAGRDALRQLSLTDSAQDPAVQLMRALEFRSISIAQLARKLPDAARLLRGLEKRAFVQIEDVEAQRDPFRSPSARLRVEAAAPAPEGKYKKAERELMAYLDLHPGSHNLKDVEAAVKNAGEAARALGRRGILTLRPELSPISSAYNRAPHLLNAHQQAAFDHIRAAIEAKQFRTFLLQGVTGSGKTEVYLNAIDATLATGRGALLLVPEIALTPAMAGQFFHRFGDRVAILHSAFGDAERGEQWRRIRSGAAGVVVGTRSGVFAPVQNLGLVVVDEEHDSSYKQEETPRYNGRDVAIVRARAAGACVVLGLRHAQPRKPLQRRTRQVHAAAAARAHRTAPAAAGGTDRHAGRVPGHAQAEHVFAAADRRDPRCAWLRASRPCCCSTAAAFRASSPAVPAASAYSASTVRSRSLTTAATSACCAITATTPSACPATALSATASTSTSSASVASASRRSCTAFCPRRAWRAWTATP